MRKTGPKPTCECGRCTKCRARVAARRRYHGIVQPPLACGRFRESRLMLPTEPTELAYLAGLFDGEGCIYFASRQRSWYAQIAMTDEPVMRWLGTLGGTLRPRRVTGNRKPCWCWKVMAQAEVEELMSALAPYLRVKREAAGIATAEIRARRDRRDELLALERLDLRPASGV